MYIFSGNPRMVISTREDIQAFNQCWPCSTLRSSRGYWFEFAANGDLIDTDCPESDDGTAASALAGDCKAFLETGELPDWL